MRPLSWLQRSTAMGLLLAGSGLALAQTAPSQGALQIPGSMLQGRSLEEIDQSLELLRNAMWAMPEAMGNKATAPGGATMANDISEIVLREEARKAISDARAAAASTLAQSPDADPATVLAPLADLVRTEMARLTLLMMRWSEPELTKIHMRYIGPMLAHASPEDSGRLQARISTAEAGLGELREMAASPRPLEFQSGERIGEILQALNASYNSVRAELVASGAADALLDREYRERSTPCPEPAKPKSGDASLSLRHAPDPSAFYPKELQQFDIEGMARVELHVSPEGCVTQVRTIKSSGVPELDEAAEKFALETELYPASSGGKAITTVSVLPVRFQLVESLPEQANLGTPSP